nr:MAG TPA: hypothetical protein [Caudoviricetes sp.]
MSPFPAAPRSGAGAGSPKRAERPRRCGAGSGEARGPP